MKPSFLSRTQSPLSFASFFFSFLVALLAFACGSGGGRTITSSDPLDAAEGYDASSARTYVTDTTKSYITWVGSKVTGKHNGRMAIAQGQFILSQDSLVGGEATIPLSSLQVEDITDADEAAKLAGHLLSEDFFKAEEFPNIRFELVSVAPYDPSVYLDKKEYESKGQPATSSAYRVENPSINMTGNLTIRGVTRSITIPVQMTLSEGQLNLEARFNIDRTEWGVNYGDENSVADKAVDRFVYNTINLGFYVESFLVTEATETQ